MSRRAARIALRSAVLSLALASPCLAEQPTQPAHFPARCACGYPAAHYHTSPGGPAYALPEASRALGRPGGAPNGVFDPGPINGLPRGRRYYGGRFFGSFNNRFYGPQYGNF